MIITGSFPDFYNETMLPAIRQVIRDRYRQYPIMFTRVFDVVSSSKSIEQYAGRTGVGLLTEIPEATPIGQDFPVKRFPKTFKARKFGLSVPVSRESVEDDQFGLLKNLFKDLADSARETREIQAASDFNNAFDSAFPGPDGKALCATDHPLEKAGGVQTNRLSVSADLDFPSLELAYTDYELTKDSTGKIRRTPAKYLMAAPANRVNAYQLTKSTDRPDTANRATNALRFLDAGMPEPFIWPQLADPDAWFLAAGAGDNGLVWIERKAPYQARWSDDAAEVMYEALRYRAEHGFYDFRGVYGSPGA